MSFYMSYRTITLRLRGAVWQRWPCEMIKSLDLPELALTACNDWLTTDICTGGSDGPWLVPLRATAVETPEECYECEKQWSEH